MLADLDLKSLDNQLFDEALKLIPNGTQTLSKSPLRFVNGVYPKFIVAGRGCNVVDTSGNVYIDFICGLGPIILGYNNLIVDSMVINCIRNFGVNHSLPHPLEYVLARELNKHIPSAEQVKYFKTGSDAMSVAVKVARAYTNRNLVYVCGYHGWHDWYTVGTLKNSGIPFELKQYVKKFDYNSLGVFDSLKRDKPAAVVLEPVVYDSPDMHWLETLKALCELEGVLLIFDEIVTGFRWGLGGAQKHFGVTPHLSCFSKAMGNGYSVAAVVGKKEYMHVFERDDFFASGTFGGELIGISAALSVISQLDSGDVVKTIWDLGKELKIGFNKICMNLGLDSVRCSGYPPRTFFDFPSVAHKSLFWQECIKRGVLFGYANFIQLEHQVNGTIGRTLNVAEDSLKVVKNNWENPKEALEGEMPIEVFRLR